jgi:hypothetical protein
MTPDQTKKADAILTGLAKQATPAIDLVKLARACPEMGDLGLGVEESGEAAERFLRAGTSAP